MSCALCGGNHSTSHCAERLATVTAQRDELLAAAQGAYRAIVLGNGREIDWNTIADKLHAAIASAQKGQP